MFSDLQQATEPSFEYAITGALCRVFKKYHWFFLFIATGDSTLMDFDDLQYMLGTTAPLGN